MEHHPSYSCDWCGEEDSGFLTASHPLPPPGWSSIRGLFIEEHYCTPVCLAAGVDQLAFVNPSTASTVYVIQRGDRGPVKIGFTNDPAQRFAALQRSFPEPLIIHFAFRGDRATEAFMHNVLRKFHRGGEWFSEAAIWEPSRAAYFASPLARSLQERREQWIFSGAYDKHMEALNDLSNARNARGASASQE